MTTVLRGFAPGPASAPPCPYCGNKHYCLEDDGDPASLRVQCWCGATARILRTDPDLGDFLVIGDSPL